MPSPTPDLLTTTEAGELIGRTQDAVRIAINLGYLRAVNERGRWYIERDALVAWDKRARRFVRTRTPSWERAAEIIAEYGSVSAAELAQLAGIHIGNARKHLAILAKNGRVRCLDDGQWVLLGRQHQGVA